MHTMLKDCCTTTEDLGCVCHCGTVDTGQVAALTGDYTIEEALNSGVALFTLALVATDPIKFTSPFNENQTVIFKVKDPAGNYVGDCYQVRTEVCLDQGDAVKVA